MAFIVIYDANVLVPSVLRDVLIRVAMSGLVRARWTSRILDETFSAIARNRPDLPSEKLERTRELMSASIRDVLVEDWESLETAIALPDDKDRHVVAAAIRAHAQLIVSFNMRDFPAEELTKWNLEAKHPDDFLVDQFHLDPVALHLIIKQIADSYVNPLWTAAQVLDALEKCGTHQTVALLRR